MTPELQRQCLLLLQSHQSEITKLQHDKNIANLKLDDAKKKIKELIEDNENKTQQLVDQFVKLHKNMTEEIKSLRAEVEAKDGIQPEDLEVALSKAFSEN